MGTLDFAYSDINLELSHNLFNHFYFFCFGIILLSLSLSSIVYNQQNYLLVLIGLEILLLSISLLYIFTSLGFYVINGFVYCLVLLALAGIESAIGLCFVINVYFFFKNLDLDNFLYLKG